MPAALPELPDGPACPRALARAAGAPPQALRLRRKAFSAAGNAAFLPRKRRFAADVVHLDGASPCWAGRELDAGALPWARSPPAQRRAAWEGGLQPDSRSGRRGHAPASAEHRAPAPLQPREVLQSKLSQILASSSDSEEDPLEELAVEPNQAVAAIGRAIYEVLRLDPTGRTRRIYVKRRDLLRGMRLQPRDLRRIDPSLASLTKPTTSITVKENALLVQLGGVRAIMLADKCLLFEPETVSSRKFLEAVTPRLQEAKRRRQLGEADEAGAPPFELECLEGAFLVAIGRLDAEMEAATRRMGAVLDKLPKEINPVNLEELRRVKQALVELESKADQLRDMVEEIMDDEDEVRDLNLSSRPLREERRRVRERERLERGMAAARVAEADAMLAHRPSASRGAAWSGGPAGAATPDDGRREADSPRGYEAESEEGYNAEWALEEMEEAEAEERETEEVEDLLEYYLQRAAATQSEAERLLDGARDLEESIGVSLSARRFEVNRLELTLSIGSFAAGLGAMVAGIFGMNLTSTWEASVVGFWGMTGLIVVGCIWVVWALYSYTRRRRIL